MEKIAQNRSFLNKFKEKANLGGAVLERYNKEFGDIMSNLRQVDERTRTSAIELKQIVKDTKALLRRKYYMEVAMNVSAFHERCRYISSELNKFKNNVESKHYDFLLEQLEKDQAEKLLGYNPNKEASVKLEFLVKNAGISDWWFNISDPVAGLFHSLTEEKPLAMRAMEKRFNKGFFKTVVDQSSLIVSETSAFFSRIVSIFKILADALAARKIDLYTETCATFVKEFEIYHKKFMKYYDLVIAPLKKYDEQMKKDMDEKARMDEEQKAKALEDEAAKQREERRLLELSKTQPVPAANPDLIKSAPLPSKDEKEQVLNKLENQHENNELPSDTVVTDISNLIKDKKDEKKVASGFVNKLTKLAKQGDVYSMVNELLSFSEEIDGSNSELSLKILALAEDALEKNAGMFDFLKKDKGENKNPLA